MKSPWDRATAALLLLVALLIAATFRDYGLSWDEPFHIEYGARLLRYYTSWGADTSAFHYINLYLYGGLFDAPVALLVKWLPFDLIDSRHLLIALTGLLGIIGSWRLARLLAGPRAGFSAALLLVTMPGWYGHMFINPKDIPFAVTMIWATYALARLLRQLPVVAWRDVLLFGLFAGAAMGMRIGGVLIFAYLGAALGLWFMLAWLWRRGPLLPLLRQSWSLLPQLLVGVAVAYGVMVIVWPWALSAPLLHPYEALTTFSRFPFSTPVLVEGEWLKSTELPIDYLPLMILVKVPLLHLLLLAALVPLAGRGLRRLREQVQQGDASWLPWSVTLIALLLPIVYVLLSRPVLYNEMRHFLFVLPPLAVLAGVSLDRLGSYLWRSVRVERTLITLLLVAYMASHLVSMARLHPYQYVAYNSAVGGISGAQRLFELDYWSTSLREVYAELKQQLRRREGEAALHRPWRIRICGAPEVSLYYFEPEWQPLWIGATGEADFEVGSSGHACPPPTGPLMVEVRRDGALLGYARDLRRTTP
ncbi:MAG TPA: glycosyltransferase family 39 protein [Gammaproteobacteria bacterium]